MRRVSLGDLVKIRTGKLDANASSPCGEYEFFTCAIEPLKINSYSYDCECVLVAGNGDLNVKYYDGKFDAYQRTYIIESNNKKALDVRYLFHFMSKYVEILREGSIGGVIKYIKLAHLTEAQVPLPPLEEQKRIAAILDKADAIRKKRKRAIELTEQFLRSAFLDMFGDPVTNPTGFPIHRLGDLCDVRDGTHDSPKYVDEGFPLVTSKNLANGEINLSTAKLISVTDYEQINRRSKVDSGDILMPMIGTVGNPVLVENKPDYAIKNVALIKFCKDSPSNIYIQSLLSSHYFDFISAQKNRGGTQKFLSLGDIRTLPIPLAPDGLQHRFVELRNSLHSQKLTQLYAIKKAENLFGTIIQRAFRGEL